MIVQPGFSTHPKTLALRCVIGPSAVEVVVRIWEYAHLNSACLGKIDGKFIKMITGYGGQAQKLWAALTVPLVTGKGPWLDVDAEGHVTVHEWEEYNPGLRSSRENGRKGGRPPKTRGFPTDADAENPQDNPQVREGGREVQEVRRKEGRRTPTLEAALAYFRKMEAPYTEEEIRTAWCSFQATAQDGVWFWGQRPVSDWRSALEARIPARERKGGGAKSGAAGEVSATVAAVQVSRRKAEIQKELEQIGEALDAEYQAHGPLDPRLKARESELQQELAKL